MAISKPSKNSQDQSNEADVTDSQIRPSDILARCKDPQVPSSVTRLTTDSSKQTGRGWSFLNWLESLWRSQEHGGDDETENTPKNAGKAITQSKRSTKAEEYGIVPVRNAKRASTNLSNRFKRRSERRAGTFPIFKHYARSKAWGGLKGNHGDNDNAGGPITEQPQRLSKSLPDHFDTLPKQPREGNDAEDLTSCSTRWLPSGRSESLEHCFGPGEVVHNDGRQDRSLNHPVSELQASTKRLSESSYFVVAVDKPCSSDPYERALDQELDAVATFADQAEEDKESTLDDKSRMLDKNIKTIAKFASQAAKDSGYFFQPAQLQVLSNTLLDAPPMTINVAASRSFTSTSRTTDRLKVTSYRESAPEYDTYANVQDYTVHPPTDLMEASHVVPTTNHSPFRQKRESQQTSVSEVSNGYNDSSFEGFNTSALYMGGQFPDADFKIEIDEEIEPVETVDENDRRMVEKRKRDLAPVLTLSANNGTGQSGTFDSLLDPEIPSRSLGYSVAHWMLQTFVRSWTELCRFVHLSNVFSSVDKLTSLVGYIHLDALVCANWFCDATTVRPFGGKSTGQKRAMTSYIPSIDSASVDIPYSYAQIFVENSDAESGDVEIWHLSRRIRQPGNADETQDSPKYANSESPPYSLEDYDYSVAPIAISSGTSPHTSPRPTSRSPLSLQSRMSSRHQSFSQPPPWTDHRSVSPTGRTAIVSAELSALDDAQVDAQG